MELRHLRYFVAVAEELSFTRAASRLHTAQPSLSQQIRQLENEVGVPLFERTRHHVRLTAAGKLFLSDAQEILSRVDRAVRRAARAAAGEVELSVGTFPAADVKVLPRLRPLLAARLPQLHLVLHSKYAVDPVAGLRQGRLDVAFLRRPLVEADLIGTAIAREPIMVVLPADHALAGKKRIRVDHIDTLRCIPTSRLVAPGLHDAVAAFCQQANVPIHSVHGADNVVSHLHMVAAGLGFALLPDYVGTILPAGVVMRPLDWDPVPAVTIVMARRRETPAPTLQAFLDLVAEISVPQPKDLPHLTVRGRKS
jgi:LysR family hca operon transcriptional activator